MSRGVINLDKTFLSPSQWRKDFQWRRDLDLTEVIFPETGLPILPDTSFLSPSKFYRFTKEDNPYNSLDTSTSSQSDINMMPHDNKKRNIRDIPHSPLVDIHQLENRSYIGNDGSFSISQNRNIMGDATPINFKSGKVFKKKKQHNLNFPDISFSESLSDSVLMDTPKKLFATRRETFNKCIRKSGMGNVEAHNVTQDSSLNKKVNKSASDVFKKPFQKTMKITEFFNVSASENESTTNANTDPDMNLSRSLNDIIAKRKTKKKNIRKAPKTVAKEKDDFNVDLTNNYSSTEGDTEPLFHQSNLQRPFFRKTTQNDEDAFNVDFTLNETNTTSSLNPVNKTTQNDGKNSWDLFRKDNKISDPFNVTYSNSLEMCSQLSSQKSTTNEIIKNQHIESIQNPFDVDFTESSIDVTNTSAIGLTQLQDMNDTSIQMEESYATVDEPNDSVPVVNDQDKGHSDVMNKSKNKSQVDSTDIQTARRSNYERKSDINKSNKSPLLTEARTSVLNQIENNDSIVSNDLNSSTKPENLRITRAYSKIKNMSESYLMNQSGDSIISANNSKKKGNKKSKSPSKSVTGQSYKNVDESNDSVPIVNDQDKHHSDLMNKSKNKSRVDLTDLQSPKRSSFEHKSDKNRSNKSPLLTEARTSALNQMENNDSFISNDLNSSAKSAYSVGRNLPEADLIGNSHSIVSVQSADSSKRKKRGKTSDIGFSESITSEMRVYDNQEHEKDKSAISESSPRHTRGNVHNFISEPFVPVTDHNHINENSSFEILSSSKNSKKGKSPVSKCVSENITPLNESNRKRNHDLRDLNASLSSKRNLKKSKNTVSNLDSEEVTSMNVSNRMRNDVEQFNTSKCSENTSTSNLEKNQNRHTDQFRTTEKWTQRLNSWEARFRKSLSNKLTEEETVKKTKPIGNKKEKKSQVVKKRWRKPASFATKRLEYYIFSKLKDRYGLDTTIKTKEFILNLCETVKIVRRRTQYQASLIKTLKTDMAKLGIIETTVDFYRFIWDYLPLAFEEKVIPCVQPVTNEVFPPSFVGNEFDKILS